MVIECYLPNDIIFLLNCLYIPNVSRNNSKISRQVIFLTTRALDLSEYLPLILLCLFT
jgi:hypothetical protein